MYILKSIFHSVVWAITSFLLTLGVQNGDKILTIELRNSQTKNLWTLNFWRNKKSTTLKSKLQREYSRAINLRRPSLLQYPKRSTSYPLTDFLVLNPTTQIFHQHKQMRKDCGSTGISSICPQELNNKSEIELNGWVLLLQQHKDTQQEGVFFC